MVTQSTVALKRSTRREWEGKGDPVRSYYWSPTGEFHLLFCVVVIMTIPNNYYKRQKGNDKVAGPLFPQILSLYSLSRIRWRSVVGPVTTSQSWWGSTWQRLSQPPPQAAVSHPCSPGLLGMPGRAGCLLWKVRAKNVCLPSRPSSSQQGYWWEGALRTVREDNN